MPHYVVVAEADFEAAEARGDRWCLKRMCICASTCDRCEVPESVTLTEARQRHLFVFAPDSPSER